MHSFEKLGATAQGKVAFRLIFMELKTIARKFALKNAFDYGKAEVKSVVGKVIAEFPDAKKDMKTAMVEISAAVDEANALVKEELEKALSTFTFEEKKEEGEKKFVLPGAEKGSVVTRFLPEPNGPPHLGHAKAAFLSAEFARQYDGKCLLRWDDTNPEKETEEFEYQIRNGMQWLGLRFARESYASDYLEKFYGFAETMIERGDAYVCSCSQEEMKKNRMESVACNCRSRGVDENAALWKKMLSREMKEGEATLRLKADLKSLNTTMRDPVLFRIMLTPHYRQGEKYCVWPVYDFEACIVDSMEGVTHALRSKEYELRDELYYFILDKFNLRKPFVYDFSRLDIQGTVLSKRVLRPLIESKKVWGWDDPRLPTLMGLKRRGLLPEAIRSFVLSF
ncbi:MAG: glutamate--tRNA ligase, partial [Candidatus Micrarchaeota archaeon]